MLGTLKWFCDEFVVKFVRREVCVCEGLFHLFCTLTKQRDCLAKLGESYTPNIIARPIVLRRVHVFLGLYGSLPKILLILAERKTDSRFSGPFDLAAFRALEPEARCSVLAAS